MKKLKSGGSFHSCLLTRGTCKDLATFPRRAFDSFCLKWHLCSSWTVFEQWYRYRTNKPEFSCPPVIWCEKSNPGCHVCASNGSVNKQDAMSVTVWTFTQVKKVRVTNITSHLSAQVSLQPTVRNRDQEVGLGFLQLAQRLPSSCFFCTSPFSKRQENKVRLERQHLYRSWR